MISNVAAMNLYRRPDGPFWSANEVLSPEQIRALQSERLREQVHYVWHHNAWYREKWQNHGVSYEEIRTLDDVRKLPQTTKEEIRTSQETNPPYGMMLCDHIDHRDIVRVAMTSGTTGNPVLLPFTPHDYYGNWLEGVVRSLWAVGIRPGDKVHCAFGFTPFIGLAGAYDACEHLIGAMVIPGGSWDTKTRLKMIRHLGINVLMGTPTYMLHMARVAHEMEIDPRKLGVRLIYTTGEPGPLSAPNTARRLQDLWDAQQICEFSGTQETEYFAWSCPEGSGHLNEDLVLFEVLDPDTHEPVPPGESGMLVVTDLVQKTHPLIRFATGDIVRGIAPSQCACGRTLSLFKGFMGRTGDTIKIRGVSVSVAGVENVVRGNPSLSDNYEIVATTAPETGLDQVRVRAEPAPDVNESQWPGLKARLAEDLRINSFVSMDVEFVPPGTLPLYELKAKRFFDHRNRLD